MFDGGELRLVLLHLMQTQPRYGYDLIREIEARTGGSYVPSPGIIYPTLTLLEELEHIAPAVSDAARPDSAKRAFILTEKGRAFLNLNHADVETTLKRLDALRQAASQIEAGPIVRAMQNLKAVLEQRLTRAPDRDSIFKIADLIDEAARQVERLP